MKDLNLPSQQAQGEITGRTSLENQFTDWRGCLLKKINQVKNPTAPIKFHTISNRTYNLPFQCCLVLQNGDQFHAIFFFWRKVGLASNSLEMNRKISVYYVDQRIVIHLLLALIVQCRYGFFAPKFYTDIILHFWVTTCQGIVQYANRFTEAFQEVSGDFCSMVSLKTTICRKLSSIFI